MSVIAARETRASGLLGEAAKLGAFLRRDLLIAWSYRASFVGDWAALLLQTLMFAFVGRLVDTGRLPAYGGHPVTYMEFVAVGIVLGAFIHLALGRVATGIRLEQTTGTLEPLLMTPTSPATVQIGSVLYDLVYIPVRTALFLLAISLVFGLQFRTAGIAPAALVLLAFVPFVWGLGVAAAAAVLTFRRGGGTVGLGVSVLTLFSGAYFPLSVLPAWVASAAAYNPVTLAVEGMRGPLLGTDGWAETAVRVAELAPVACVSLLVGIQAFRLALARERRLGTLGLY